MINEEKLTEAIQTLECFDNPILKDIADDMKAVHESEYGGMKGLIRQVAKSNDCQPEDIINGGSNGKETLMRQQIAIEAKKRRYSHQAIADALNRTTSTVSHYINSYHATSD